MCAAHSSKMVDSWHRGSDRTAYGKADLAESVAVARAEEARVAAAAPAAAAAGLVVSVGSG